MSDHEKYFYHESISKQASHTVNRTIPNQKYEIKSYSYVVLINFVLMNSKSSYMSL